MAKKSAIEIAAEKEAIKAYKKTLDEIRAEVALFFEKYARGNSLTYQEANKYDRLLKLEKEIADELKALGVAVNEINYKYASRAYQDAYYREAYDIEMATKQDLGYSTLTKAVIAASIYSLISGASVKDRISKNTNDLNFNVKSSLVRGLVDGRGYVEIARDFKGLIEKDAYKAVRVVATEIHRNSIEAKTQAISEAEDAGIKIKKVWVATLDNNTRETHGALDGVSVEADEDFEWTAADGSHVSAAGPGLSGNAGEDINCRCTVTSRVDGNSAPETRRYDGGIYENITYKEWLELHKVPNAA